MNWFLEIINQVLQTQATFTPVVCDTEECPATAFNAVAAAFATQGYFMQAEMLYNILGTDFNYWAPFLYLLAAAGGVVGMALGAPPKMYLWFFIGPGIYDWLVQERSETYGVQWQVADRLQDQRAVWRLAHVGLLNSPLTQRIESGGADTDYEGSGSVQQSKWCEKPQNPVAVSMFFLQFDALVSHTVNRLVAMTGIGRTSDVTVGTADGQGVLPIQGVTTDPNSWYLIADKKWVILDSITSARLSNGDLRDTFQTFLSSECGDQLSLAIDHTNFVSAAHSDSTLPCTVMLHTNTDDIRKKGESCTAKPATFAQDNYTLVWDVLRSTVVPVPESSRRLFQDTSIGSFRHFLNGFSGSVGQATASFYKNQDYAECHQIFYTIMQAFRWEASQVMHQLKYSGPLGMEPDKLLFNLFYGWGVREELGGKLVEEKDLEKWTTNLILVHLLRNELAVAPRVADKKYTNELSLQSYTENFSSQTGAKTKYGEVYTWARMVPYMQGIMLYLLAMAYPFACIMIVMPGKHKILITWMSFWVWVKLWDAGFAIVTVLERSIWSMLGNSTKMNYVSPLVNQMQEWSTTVPKEWCPIGAADGLGSKECFGDIGQTISCTVIPDFQADPSLGSLWWHAAAIFDRALLLGSTIDIDVASGYYVYLMSALYFAVPAATGQLVLGAKAGVAGMLTGLTQGLQQDAGRGSSSGFLGDLRGKAAAGAAAMRQESHAKGLRAGGFADQSFEAGNRGLEAGLMSASAEAANRQIGLANSNSGLAQSYLQGRAQVAGAKANANQAVSGAAVAQFAEKAGGLKDPAKAIPADVMSWAAGLTGKNNRNPDSSPQTQANEASPQSSSASAADAGGPQASGQGAAGPTGWVAGKWAGFANGMNILQNGNQAFGAIAPIMNARSSLATLGQQQASLGITAGVTRMQAGFNADQSYNNMQGFEASSQSNALGIGERRYGQAADYGAQMATYQATSNLSDSAAGYIGSLGGDASVFSPTSKPTDITGMAMSGRLGMSAQQSSTWAMGGFFNAQGNAVSGLNSNFGSGYVNQAYTGLVDNPANSVRNFGNSINTTGNSFVENEGVIKHARPGDR